MPETPLPDWDPRSEEVLRDQIASYDAMRRKCPVAHDDYLQWSLFRHADVVHVLDDHATFSNAVSQHLSVPNGMDPPEHTGFRQLIERYFVPEAMAAFEPECRRISSRLVDRISTGLPVDVISVFGQDFALQVQCAFMGWPESLHEPLRTWMRRNHEATLSADREAMKDVALDFDQYIRELLKIRRSAGDAAPDDATTRLMRERVEGRPLTEGEIVSIIRNWTVGELGTITASVGILIHHLATNAEVQCLLREQPHWIPAANDEILRIHAPLISNRRKTTKAVEIGGRMIEAGERITLLWASANRDESVFGDPDEFRLDRDPNSNLLYGRGIHVCPGAPLARLELRVLMEELLANSEWIEIVEERPAVRAAYPGSGFSALFVKLRRSHSGHSSRGG
jgi:cytochrome P450